MTAAWRGQGPWRDVAAAQGGVISRAQLRASGWTASDVDHAGRYGGWRPMSPGVYAVHLGPLPPVARDWAALLRCGRGAVLASWSALRSWGVEVPADLAPTQLVHVGVDRDRRIAEHAGVCLHRRVRHSAGVHPAALPPRHRLEVAALDAVEECPGDQAMLTLVLGLLQSRRTTVPRLLAEVQARGRLRGRPLLLQVLGDAAAGVASALEALYLRSVHRRHGLPPAQFNAPEVQEGRRVYRDVRYDGVVVELDGARHGEVLAAALDRRRDNDATLRGLITLRFGWLEVVTDPCGVAVIVIKALQAALGAAAERVGRDRPGPGLRGVRPCGPGCPVAGLLG